MAVGLKMKAVGVDLRSVTKRFGTVTAVDNVSLAIEPGEFVLLLGPSGCGKTTTLRLVAGFETPDAGQVAIGGKRVDHVPTYRRNLGMVFQSYALFPHLTVADNIGFGLSIRGTPRSEIQGRVKAMLELVRMPGYADRYPHQLSGGEQQRVALARALAVNPQVLLLDEPFGALDRKLRQEMQGELRDLQHELGVTTIFVTHDQEEALLMADRIAVMERGRVEQLDEPTVVYERPRTHFVATFLGEANLFSGPVREVEGGTVEVEETGNLIRATCQGAPPAAGQTVEVMVRPERVRLETGPGGPNRVPGRIQRKRYLGEKFRYEVRLESGKSVLAVLPASADGRFEVGQDVWAAWAPADTLVLEG